MQPHQLAPAVFEHVTRMVDYTVEDVSPDISVLVMLDMLNESLIARGEYPVAC